MEINRISSKNAPLPIGPYHQAVAVENIVFTSGQIPIDPRTNQLVTGNTASQTRQVFENLRAVLEASGSSLDYVVQVNLFLTDLSNFDQVNQIFEEYFGRAKPTRTTLQVSALPKGAAIEANATACIPS